MNDALPTDERDRTNVAAKLPANVRLLGAASLLNDIASEMIYPLMPQFLITVLGGNRFYLGVIEGFAESVASLLKLASGAWSDRAGQRKTLIVGGYVMAAIARPLIGLAVAPWQLFAARITDRIGKGLRTSPRDALIADSTPSAMRGRAFGYHRAMDHLGAAVGPLLATAFLLWRPGDLRALFLLTLLPGIGVAVILIVGLREASTTKSIAEKSVTPTEPLNRGFYLYLTALLIFTLGNSSDAFLLVRAGELGVPTEYLPLLWTAFHMIKSIGNRFAGRAADVVGPHPMILLGWIIYAILYVAFARIGTAWQFWVAFLLYGVFYALTEPAEKKLVTDLVGTRPKGAAFGWFNFAIGIAALPSSLIFGWLYEQSGALMAFGWGASMALIAAILLAFVRVPPSADER